MSFGGVSNLRENIKIFIISENIIGTMAGVTIAIAAGNMIQSFVKEIIFPSIYYFLKYKKLGDFSPIDAAHISKFGKEFITFTFVVIITFIFIKYILELFLNMRGDVKQKRSSTMSNNRGIYNN